MMNGEDDNSAHRLFGRRRLWRRLGIAVFAFATPVLLVFVYIRLAGPAAIVSAPNRGEHFMNRLDSDPQILTAVGVHRQFQIEVGPPEASLRVWIVEPVDRSGNISGDVGGTVILLHGIRDDKRSMVGLGRRFSEAGFRCVLPDLRGHGESSGDWLTYGVVESRDLSQMIDALAQKGLIAGRIGVLGVSYGGATALMLAGRDARIDAVVAVASFRSMRDVVPNYVRSNLPMGGLLPKRWIENVIKEGGELADFDPDEAKPIDWILRSRAQVLLIHGREDRKIPPSHSESLHAAIADRSRLILVEGEDHDSISLDRTGTIGRESINWFTHHLRSTGSKGQ